MEKITISKKGTGKMNKKGEIEMSYDYVSLIAELKRKQRKLKLKKIERKSNESRNTK